MSASTTTAVPEVECDGLGITYDIIEGERVEWTMGAFEVTVTKILYDELCLFCRDHELGAVFQEMYFRMRAGRSLTRPDVAFLSFSSNPKRKLRPPRNKEAWHIVPDLAVEVISPNEKMSESMPKLQRYFEAGVKSVWHVMPFIESVFVYDSMKKITVFQNGDEMECPALFPGWKLPVATLFPPETED